jgi:hypothetical protein
MSSHDPARRLDPRALVLGGVTTFAWYAVPDVVGPRWARALAKTGVAVVGAALAVTVTRGGASARAEVRAFREEARAEVARLADPGPALPGVEDEGRVDPDDCPACSDNPAPLDLPTDAAEVVTPRPGVAMVAVLGAAALATAAGVAGERWVYRRAEALRARGVRRPHLLVGAGMGVLGAALAAFDVPPEPEHDAVVSGSATPR